MYNNTHIYKTAQTLSLCFKNFRTRGGVSNRVCGIACSCGGQLASASGQPVTIGPTTESRAEVVELEANRQGSVHQKHQHHNHSSQLEGGGERGGGRGGGGGGGGREGGEHHLY